MLEVLFVSGLGHRQDSKQAHSVQVQNEAIGVSHSEPPLTAQLCIVGCRFRSMCGQPTFWEIVDALARQHIVNFAYPSHGRDVIARNFGVTYDHCVAHLIIHGLVHQFQHMPVGRRSLKVTKTGSAHRSRRTAAVRRREKRGQRDARLYMISSSRSICARSMCLVTTTNTCTGRRHDPASIKYVGLRSVKLYALAVPCCLSRPDK